MHYIGMQDQSDTFNMFDAQAWYSRDVRGSHRATKPRGDAREQRRMACTRRELENAEHAIWFQGDYTKELLELTDYPKFDVETVNKTFMEWEHHKAENIMGFRDNAYRSIMTGKMSPVHHTPWLTAMDDSMASYLGKM